MAAMRLIPYRLIGRPWIVLILVSLMCSGTGAVWAQERLTFSYAALGGPNSIWNIAKDVGFYKKHGLDAEVVYIASSTLSARCPIGRGTRTTRSGRSPPVSRSSSTSRSGRPA